MTAVPAAHAWASNAALIADVAELGYVKGTVLDCTYGKGNFWKVYCPPLLTGIDIDPHLQNEDGKIRCPSGCNFTELPWHWSHPPLFDTVVFDPPYRLHGTLDRGEFDRRYGLAPRNVSQQMQLLFDGFHECAKVLKSCGYLLVKCQDQVVSGNVRWQTDQLTQLGKWLNLTKVDAFLMLSPVRPQPVGRRQVHARRNYSSLLIFEKD